LRILLAEDDSMLADGLARALRQSSYVVDWVHDGKQADSWLASQNYDLVILDLGLPWLEGGEVLRRLRERRQRLPVLILSAREALEERVRLLDLGADDYLVKPFGVPELLARLRALLRRRDGGNPAKGPVYRFGDVTADMVTRSVIKAGVEVHLTVVEFRLLAELLRAEGRITTQRHLLREVWGPGHESNTHYLRIYMGHLRRKLEDDPARPRHLLTETGVGCRCLCERSPET